MMIERKNICTLANTPFSHFTEALNLFFIFLFTLIKLADSSADMCKILLHNFYICANHFLMGYLLNGKPYMENRQAKSGRLFYFWRVFSSGVVKKIRSARISVMALRRMQLQRKSLMTLIARVGNKDRLRVLRKINFGSV